MGLFQAGDGKATSILDKVRNLATIIMTATEPALISRAEVAYNDNTNNNNNNNNFRDRRHLQRLSSHI